MPIRKGQRVVSAYHLNGRPSVNVPRGASGIVVSESMDPNIHLVYFPSASQMIYVRDEHIIPDRRIIPREFYG